MSICEPSSREEQQGRKEELEELGGGIHRAKKDARTIKKDFSMKR